MTKPYPEPQIRRTKDVGRIIDRVSNETARAMEVGFQSLAARGHPAEEASITASVAALTPICAHLIVAMGCRECPSEDEVRKLIHGVLSIHSEFVAEKKGESR